MRQEDIFHFIMKTRKERGIRREDFEQLSKTSAYGSMLEVFGGKAITVGIKNIILMLDALDLQFVIEDKDAEWGPDMARLRMMPKKLYLAERIEARPIVIENGFYPRVDLFDNVETALKFMTKPCDLYEVSIGHLIRKKFDVIDHPYGTMYSYNEHIPAEAIVGMVTHR